MYGFSIAFRSCVSLTPLLWLHQALAVCFCVLLLHQEYCLKMPGCITPECFCNMFVAHGFYVKSKSHLPVVPQKAVAEVSREACRGRRLAEMDGWWTDPLKERRLESVGLSFWLSACLPLCPSNHLLTYFFIHSSCTNIIKLSLDPAIQIYVPSNQLSAWPPTSCSIYVYRSAFLSRLTS